MKRIKVKTIKKLAGIGKAAHELGNKKNFISSGGNTQLHIRKTVTK